MKFKLYVLLFSLLAISLPTIAMDSSPSRSPQTPNLVETMQALLDSISDQEWQQYSQIEEAKIARLKEIIKNSISNRNQALAALNELENLAQQQISNFKMLEKNKKKPQNRIDNLQTLNKKQLAQLFKNYACNNSNSKPSVIDLFPIDNNNSSAISNNTESSGSSNPGSPSNNNNCTTTNSTNDNANNSNNDNASTHSEEPPALAANETVDVPDSNDSSIAEQIFNAVRSNNFDQVKQLMESNPNLKDCRDSKNNTLLHPAVMVKNEEMVNYLIDKGVDPTQCNEMGNSAVKAAQGNKTLDYKSIRIFNNLNNTLPENERLQDNEYRNDASGNASDSDDDNLDEALDDFNDEYKKESYDASTTSENNNDNSSHNNTEDNNNNNNAVETYEEEQSSVLDNSNNDNTHEEESARNNESSVVEANPDQESNSPQDARENDDANNLNTTDANNSSSRDEEDEDYLSKIELDIFEDTKDSSLKTLVTKKMIIGTSVGIIALAGASKIALYIVKNTELDWNKKAIDALIQLAKNPEQYANSTKMYLAIESNLTLVSPEIKQQLRTLFENENYNEFIARITTLELEQPQSTNKLARLIKQIKHGLKNDLVEYNALNVWHKMCKLIHR